MTIGPGPRMRMVWSSRRLGMSVVLHRSDEPVEQRRHVVRSRAGLRMSLEAEGRCVGQLEALVGSVEQRAVGDAGVGRQRGFVDREAVVLRGEDRKSVV